MSDKIQKIKQEIESYKESMKGLEPHSDFRRGQLTAYNQIMQFIDSLPEKPASDDLEEEITKCYKSRIDLMMTRKQFGELIHHFTDWQHGKDFDDLLQSQMNFPKEFYERGKSDAIKEMMKDAVEGTVVGRDRSTMPPFQTKCKIVVDRVSIDAKEDDKVKLIIVKNEQQ
jgi:hypothetical protein